MKTEIIPIHHPELNRICRNIIIAGELIAFPTDTVYGVAANLFSAEAIDKIYEVKERVYDKAIPVLIGSTQQLPLVALQPEDNPRALRLAEQFWPGALTLIFNKHPQIPGNISPSDTIGVRMPDHAQIIELLQFTGPLATTSANLSGHENPLSADDVYNQLNGRIALIVDGGNTPGTIPSTVVDCSISNQLKILREGDITADMLNQALNR